MPVTTLTPKGIKSLICLPGQAKVDHHDAGCKGLMLELRTTGGKTWYLRYRDSHGKQRQFRLGDVEDLSLEQARKRADELRGQIALGKDPCEEKAMLRQVPTFGAFIAERYMPFVKGYKRSWQTDDSLLRNHLLPVFEKKHLDQITKNDIVALHHGRRADGAAPGSANRLLIMLRYIFNLAIRWEVPGITKNPTANVPLFEENNKMERYLTKDEARRLYVQVKTSENTMLQYIIPMLIMTGARKREALNAQWTDFNLAKGLWRIPISKSGKARYVPISDGVAQLLSNVREVQATWPAAMQPCPWIFPNPQTGKPYVSFFTAWNTARTKAGLADVRIHDLRHSFASFLINNGRSLYEVQKILGHTQVRTTQRYAHLSQDTLQEAASVAMNALGDAFSPKAVVVDALEPLALPMAA
jgi:integrase